MPGVIMMILSLFSSLFNFTTLRRFLMYKL